METESMEVDVNWLTRQLAVGARYPTEAVPHLTSSLGIGRVVDLRLESKDDEALLRAHGITLLHLPTEDGCAIAVNQIWDGVRWVNQQLDAGAKVLIHCQHGIGRSALLALCVLVSRGHDPLEALELAKNAREQISPSPAQLGRFLEWSHQWREQARLSWPLPTLEQLMQIAYRPLRQASGGS